MLTKPRRVEKAWGHELWIHNSPLYCGKILMVEAGRQCSLHYHERKHETFYVMYGRLILELDGQPHIIEEGSAIEIQPYVRHRFCEASGLRPAQIMEVSTQHLETDSIRVISGMLYRGGVA